jgi:hypothetical protein
VPRRLRIFSAIGIFAEYPTPSPVSSSEIGGIRHNGTAAAKPKLAKKGGFPGQNKGFGGVIKSCY